jgi:hypothetical protein
MGLAVLGVGIISSVLGLLAATEVDARAAGLALCSSCLTFRLNGDPPTRAAKM